MIRDIPFDSIRDEFIAITKDSPDIRISNVIQAGRTNDGFYFPVATGVAIADGFFLSALHVLVEDGANNVTRLR